MRDNLLRRIYSVAHEFETETLPPLKNAIFSAFAEARADIDAIGQRVDAMMMRDEQRRKEILERRIGNCLIKTEKEKERKRERKREREKERGEGRERGKERKR